MDLMGYESDVFFANFRSLAGLFENCTGATVNIHDAEDQQDLQDALRDDDRADDGGSGSGDGGGGGVGFDGILMKATWFPEFAQRGLLDDLAGRIASTPVLQWSRVLGTPRQHFATFQVYISFFLPYRYISFFLSYRYISFFLSYQYISFFLSFFLSFLVGTGVSCQLPPLRR
jgi:hypothetical protein